MPDDDRCYLACVLIVQLSYPLLLAGLEVEVVDTPCQDSIPRHHGGYSNAIRTSRQIFGMTLLGSSPKCYNGFS